MNNIEKKSYDVEFGKKVAALLKKQAVLYSDGQVGLKYTIVFPVKNNTKKAPLLSRLALKVINFQKGKIVPHFVDLTKK